MLLLVSNWCLNLSPPTTLPPSPTTPFPVPPSPNEISLVPNPIPIGPTSITYWHFTVGFRLSSHRGRYHILLGLLLSGQIEINPGPRAPKYPCGECGKGVRWGKSIACDECDTWFHKDCLQMTSINLLRLKIYLGYVADVLCPTPPPYLTPLVPRLAVLPVSPPTTPLLLHLNAKKARSNV